MTVHPLGRSPHRPLSTAVDPRPLTNRPAAGAFIAMMFGLTVLVFLMGLLALSV
jgi:hypothetical protein